MTKVKLVWVFDPLLLPLSLRLNLSSCWKASYLPLLTKYTILFKTNNYESIHLNEKNNMIM